MKETILFLILLVVVKALTGFAGNVHSRTQREGGLEEQISSSEDLSQAEYINGPVECIVVEVSTQYESANYEADFHCIEDPDGPTSMDGIVFELKELPPGFEQTYRSNFSSGRAKLRASKIYRSSYKLTFTKETIWSITDDLKVKHSEPGTDSKK